jgi:hypothetical protein
MVSALSLKPEYPTNSPMAVTRVTWASSDCAFLSGLYLRVHVADARRH